MQRTLLGEEHPQIAQTLNNLAMVLLAQGNYASAEPLLREAYLGPKHPDVAESLNNVGVVLREQGEYEASETLLSEALAMRRKLLGDEHPAARRSAEHLVTLFEMWEKPDRAADFRDILAGLLLLLPGAERAGIVMSYFRLKAAASGR